MVGIGAIIGVLGSNQIYIILEYYVEAICGWTIIEMIIYLLVTFKGLRIIQSAEVGLDTFTLSAL